MKIASEPRSSLLKRELPYLTLNSLPREKGDLVKLGAVLQLSIVITRVGVPRNRKNSGNLSCFGLLNWSEDHTPAHRQTLTRKRDEWVAVRSEEEGTLSERVTDRYSRYAGVRRRVTFGTAV